MTTTTPRTPAGDHAVSVRSIVKRFGTVTALEQVSLDIRRGEFFSLLGPSGCGKTTLLRIIGGFESPDEGDILIAGKDVAADPPYRRQTNMIFQHLALFPHLSVARNIAFGLEMKKRPQAEIDRRVTEMLKLVRLEDYGGRKIDELSGGQKQRVAIARALVNDPEVLLLDEPLGALDLQLRLQMHDELKRIHKAIGSTFILVTHDQGEAITLSDRIAVMNGGRIVQLGTPDDIYDRPRTLFVASFIGHANLVEGVVVESGKGSCRMTAGGLTIAGSAAESFAAGTPVTGVLRYERLLLLPPRASEGVPAKVESSSFFGSSYRVTVRLGSGQPLIAEVASGNGGSRHKPGDDVRVHWRDDSFVIVRS